MLTKTAAILLVLSMWSGSALAFGVGGAGGGVIGAGVSNPYKYYPVCPRGRAGESCQCRATGAAEANMLCSTGQHCDTRTGTCGAASR